MQSNPYGKPTKGNNLTFRLYSDDGDDLKTVPWNQKSSKMIHLISVLPM